MAPFFRLWKAHYEMMVQKRVCWCLHVETHIIPKVLAADLGYFKLLHHQNFLQQSPSLKYCHATIPLLGPSLYSSSCCKHGFLKLSDQPGTPKMPYHSWQYVALCYCLLCLLSNLIITEVHSGPQGLLHLLNYMKLVTLK